MAVQQERAEKLEKLVDRLARLVAAAAELKKERDMLERMLLDAARQVMKELNCKRLTLGNVEFWLVRVPADEEPDPQCVSVMIENGMSEEEAAEKCIEYEEHVAARGIEKLSMGSIDMLREKLALVAKASRLVEQAEELSQYIDLALAAAVKERIEEFKHRFCRG